MNMRKFAARLLEDGRCVLADTVLDLDAEGVKYEDLWAYAAKIGVQDVPSCFDEIELVDAIVALEQQCEFS